MPGRASAASTEFLARTEVGNDGGLIECAELEAAFGCAVNVGRLQKEAHALHLAGSSWDPSLWDKR